MNWEGIPFSAAASSTPAMNAELFFGKCEKFYSGVRVEAIGRRVSKKSVIELINYNKRKDVSLF